MVALNSLSDFGSRETEGAVSTHHQSLLAGEILLETSPHTAWGGAVQAQMYLPISRSRAWQQLTDYPRWVHYFPDVSTSKELPPSSSSSKTPPRHKRLYQAASKAFLIFSAQVEAYLRVYEILQQQIQFRFEKGSFLDFSADLQLQDLQDGTLLTYAVRATPTFPVPSIFLQQVMQMGLPDNMRHLRRALCS